MTVAQLFAIRSNGIYRSDPVVRDPKYRAFVRSFPCAVCGRHYGIEAAHTGPHGISQKASDLTCIPLCREDHRELHQVGPTRFAVMHRLNVAEIINHLNQLWTRRAA